MTKQTTTLANADNTASQRRWWYKLDIARHLGFIMGMDDKGVAEHFRSMLLALAQGERGINVMADKMMDEADAFSERQRNAGFIGAARRHGTVPENAPPSIRREIEKSLAASKPKPSGEGGKKPQAAQKPSKRKGAGGEAGDKYAELYSCPPDELPELTVEFCEDEKPRQALAFYRSALDEVGADNYRNALSRFIGSVNAGEETPNRGATFTKHYLKPIMNNKK